jgi:hypothetical protein
MTNFSYFGGSLVVEFFSDDKNKIYTKNERLVVITPIGFSKNF